MTIGQLEGCAHCYSGQRGLLRYRAGWLAPSHIQRGEIARNSIQQLESHEQAAIASPGRLMTLRLTIFSLAKEMMGKQRAPNRSRRLQCDIGAKIFQARGYR